MATTTTSSSEGHVYHVFLSFRGEDTRKGFTGHLYKALYDDGINAFIDDNELTRGEFIKNELKRAIHRSIISIVVFSKRYADSSWCLDELVEIMDCRKKLEQKVVPIFYDVEPTDVRKQTGCFERAFQKHEEGIRKQKYRGQRNAKQKQVKQWRDTLTDAANLSGYDLKNTDDGHEANFIGRIVREIDRQLNNKRALDIDYPVGIESRLEKLSKYLRIESSKESRPGKLSKVLGIESSNKYVRMVGIWGMGGIGKTTLAKAVFNQFCRSFEGSCFLADVRERAASPGGLVSLQELLLSETLNRSKMKDVGFVDRGTIMIKEKLQHRKLLVIIDDVDKVEQLEALARSHDWFGPGSRIVITTRDEQLLKPRVDDIYVAEEMDEKEAQELFIWHAFKGRHVNEEYVELSRRVVSYCRGLPLALKVLASSLATQSKEVWESQLDKLKTIPPEDVVNKLRISYKGLDNKDRDIFLDISCFFIGMDKNYVTQILEGYHGKSVETGINNLRQRSLITVSETKTLMMHDLLRDMGREIVCEDSYNDPGKRSRLWHQEDVREVLKGKSGTDKIQGLALNLEISEKASFSAQAFENIRRLKLLQLNYVELTDGYKSLSTNMLRWMCWHGFPLPSIPNQFDQESLVAMDLQNSKLILVWEESKMFTKLKFINLSHSHDLAKSPDFSKIPNLEELILQDCKSLSEVQSSIGDLQRLTLVNLEGCEMLMHLPLNFYNSKSIKTLLLNGCSRFQNLADGVGDMASLRILKANNTAIRKIPTSIVKLKNLTTLSVCGVKGSPTTHLLPPSLLGLNSLAELALAGCNLTEDRISKDLGSLISLRALNLGNNCFGSLPSLSGLSNLEDLCLDSCRNLRAIPNLPTNLKFLRAFYCFDLETMPDFSEMSNLRELYLSDSYKLTEIPGLDKSLNSMTRIHMEGCTNLIPDFRKHILLGWTSCGFGGIFLNGIYDIPDWFHCGSYCNRDNFVNIFVPGSAGRNLKGLTLSSVYSSDSKHKAPIRITIVNFTQGTELAAYITYASVSVRNNCELEDDYLWQGQLSNYMLKLQGGDDVVIGIVPRDDFVKVKRIGVSLVWDKFMNENMNGYHLCGYQLRPSLWVSNWNDALAGYNKINVAHGITDYHIYLENDNDITKSQDFSKFPNLEKLIFKGCKSLLQVHSSIGDLERLALVNLQDCEMLKDLPLNFYSSESIETLVLNGCSRFENLDDGIGDMVSLTTLRVDNTAIRQMPSSIVKLNNLGVLSVCGVTGSPSTHLLPPSLNGLYSLTELAVAGCSLTEDAIPKDLESLISLAYLNLGNNGFRRLPSLGGLSKLRKLCLDDCINLTAIPDLPINLQVLQAVGCTALETMPDFSNMSNMRQLYLSDSFELTEIPGLDKALNFMTRIHMEGCTNLTAEFRKNILQGWTSWGYGGIFLNGIDGIPEWFELVIDVNNGGSFDVRQIIFGQNLKGLTLCFLYSSDSTRPIDSKCGIGIMVFNFTKKTSFIAVIRVDRIKVSSQEPEGDYLWQGQVSNDVLRLQDGDQVLISVKSSGFGRVKKAGVHLEWDKLMKENLHDASKASYKFYTNLLFSGDRAGRSDDASVPSDQMTATNEQLAVDGCFAGLKSFLFNLFFNCFSFSHRR